ncbi:hypothetical protein B0J12DRAFT_203243 [Macrophomina phaseolina]|uniref:Uncharacterized protein n=1 Tax=Macrophomina phaseolina TaxID=35725 RepID=A0ABQ8G206_9PEZI|nr:hypothetical protein B0J12DRAFT_203243 [Macrophomina phaseolina]
MIPERAYMYDFRCCTTAQNVRPFSPNRAPISVPIPFYRFRASAAHVFGYVVVSGPSFRASHRRFPLSSLPGSYLECCCSGGTYGFAWLYVGTITSAAHSTSFGLSRLLGLLMVSCAYYPLRPSSPARASGPHISRPVAVRCRSRPISPTAALRLASYQRSYRAALPYSAHKHNRPRPLRRRQQLTGLPHTMLALSPLLTYTRSASRAEPPPPWSSSLSSSHPARCQPFVRLCREAKEDLGTPDDAHMRAASRPEQTRKAALCPAALNAPDDAHAAALDDASHLRGREVAVMPNFTLLSLALLCRARTGARAIGWVEGGAIIEF